MLGTLNNDERSIGLRAYQGYGNLDSIRDLPVGYTRESANPAAPGSTVTPVLLSDVATVTIDTPESETVSRTNGQPSLSLEVLRLPEGNTIELAEELLAVIDDLDLPPGVQVDVLYNDGPALEEQLANVVGQGGLGFIIAVSAIFLFLLQIRPTVIRGILNTLRPTLITAISIPLSVMITVLVMAVFDWSLNFMSLAGLAIAVGRIVDDSIVVLENIYRHIQVGSQRLPTSGTETVAYRLAPLGDNPRLAAAIRGTREVGPAILASTLTTVAVFLPLGFIPGIVGEFFLPFAQTVCVSLLASTLIALTVVPVLASMLLRQGDMADEDDTVVEDTWLQKIYTPILRWALNHPLLTVLGCIAAVAASLPLLIILPITLFSSGEAESMRIDVTMPENTGPAAMFREVRSVEQVLDGYVDAGYITAYQGTMGSTSQDFGPSIGESGFDVAGFFLALSEDVPEGFADELREALPDKENVDIQIFVDEAGPPQSGIEIAVTGGNFNRVQSAAATLLERIAPLDGVVNLKTNVSDSKEEVTFEVDTKEAGRYGLNSMAVAGQIRTWAYGHDAADLNLSGDTYDVVVRGKSDQVDEIVELQALPIAGAFGAVPLGSISDVKTTVGPSVVTHYDGDRSVTITGEIESRDPQAVSARISRLIADAGLAAGGDGPAGRIRKRHRGAVPKRLHRHGDWPGIGLSGDGGDPWFPAGSFHRGAQHALGGRGRPDSAHPHRTRPESSIHDGFLVPHRYRGHQCHRAHHLRRAVALPGPERVGRHHARGTHPPSPDPDDRVHHHPGPVPPGVQPSQRTGRLGVGNRCDRRADQFDLPDPGGRAGYLFATSSIRSGSCYARTPADRAPARARAGRRILMVA